MVYMVRNPCLCQIEARALFFQKLQGSENLENLDQKFGTDIEDPSGVWTIKRPLSGRGLESWERRRGGDFSDESDDE